MKIILTKDINKLGKQYDIKDVANGYARNYLFPQGLAVMATPVALRQLQTQRITMESRKQQLRARSEKTALEIEKTQLTFPMKVNEKNVPFGSITETHIAEELQKKGFRVEKHSVLLDAPLKELGKYPVSINLGAEVTATIQVVLEKS